MQKLTPISKTGYNKLHEELKRLEKEAVEVRQRVGEAREQGDLRENGEYIYGRQQLGFIEGRMGELRGKINFSKVVDCTTVSCDRVEFGAVVTLLNLDTNQKMTYQLLGPHDADIDNDSISIFSPVGEALHGLAKGEKVSVKLPRGMTNFEIIDIAKSQTE
ncbi:MAG: transcription elongation factor GreA [Planctomycetes bacterium]|nr:transcription elongation factor GreA [Planctomycetota bacterium]